MDRQVQQVMHECTRGSLDGGLPFPEVVARLTAVGCEQYHADFQRQEKTYYMPDGESHVEPMPIGKRPVAERFSGDGIVAALSAVQSGGIAYVEFLDRIMAAGCVGYFVHIAGRRAIYLSRDGEFHVEHFPAPVARIAS